MAEKKPKRSFLEIILISIIGILVVCVGLLLISPLGNSLHSVDDRTPSPTKPPTDNRNWIIYEIIYYEDQETYQNFAVGSGVTVTYVNNSGGTNQEDRFVGDGKTHYFRRYDGSHIPTEIVKPFRQGYTANFGDYFSMIAQSGDNSIGNLACTIYEADTEGAKCLIEQGTTCGIINAWKKSNCSGSFCICEVSGVYP